MRPDRARYAAGEDGQRADRCARERQSPGQPPGSCGRLALSGQHALSMRSIALAAALAAATAAWGEGPGSRLRTSPQVPPPPAAATPSTISQEEARCIQLEGQAKERCLRELRAAPPGRPPSGP